MNNLLETIIVNKTKEVEHQKALLSISSLQDLLKKHPVKISNFSKKIINTIAKNKTAVIAEIKQASPSRGIIRHNFDPVNIAIDYENNGATCLSVLTDTVFFRGDLSHMKQVSNSVDLPILRKDFIIDEYQLYETLYYGGDAILLIVCAISHELLLTLTDLAISLGLSVLVEVHNREEFLIALDLQNKHPILIGVNNRNLKTFEVDINITINLQKEFAQQNLICESGIKTSDQVTLMRENNINGFLVGEGLLIHPNPGSELKNLFKL